MKIDEPPRIRTYLVEDSPAMAERILGMIAELRPYGVENVGQAEGAARAVVDIQKLRPDVVILDLQLAEGNGFDVLKQIKKETPSPCVIVLTNHNHPRYKTKCLELGTDYFFDKSTEFHKVIEVLEGFHHESDFIDKQSYAAGLPGSTSG